MTDDTSQIVERLKFRAELALEEGAETSGGRREDAHALYQDLTDAASTIESLERERDERADQARVAASHIRSELLEEQSDG